MTTHNIQSVRVRLALFPYHDKTIGYQMCKDESIHMFAIDRLRFTYDYSAKIMVSHVGYCREVFSAKVNHPAAYLFTFKPFVKIGYQWPKIRKE